MDLAVALVTALLLSRAPAALRSVVRLRLSQRQTWVDDARQLLRSDGRTWRVGAFLALAPLYSVPSVEELELAATAKAPSIADLTPRQVDRIAALAHTNIRSQSARAGRRTLTVGEIEGAIRSHLRHVREHLGATDVVTRLSGGFVPNEYRFPAAADRFSIVTRADGTTSWIACRGRADSRPYGRGAVFTVRVVLPGQVDGRLVEST